MITETLRLTMGCSAANTFCPADATPTLPITGMFEQLRALLAAGLPEDDCRQVDTSLPVKHTSRWAQTAGPGRETAWPPASGPCRPLL
jgi:hypothetical protein